MVDMDTWKFERCLLTLRAEGEVDELLDLYLAGKFAEVLSSCHVTNILKFDSTDIWHSWSIDSVSDKVASVLDSADKRRTALLVVAASLGLLVQLNWTGPQLERPSRSPSDADQSACAIFPPNFCLTAAATDTSNDNNDKTTSAQTARQKCLDSLRVNGCSLHAQTQQPHLLWITRVLLECCDQQQQQHQQLLCRHFPSAVVWRLRYCLLYQQLLDEPAQYLLDTALAHFQLHSDCVEFLQSSVQLSVEYYMTLCTLLYQYHYVPHMKHCLSRVRSLLGLNVELTGMLGSRTYWQTPCPQLAVDISTNTTNTIDENTKNLDSNQQMTSLGDVSDDVVKRAWPCRLTCDVTQLSYSETEYGAGTLPQDVRLTDDTRRPHVQYTTDGDDNTTAVRNVNVNSLQQAVLLNMFMLDRISQGASEIRDELLTVLINEVLRTPHTWALQMSALLQRCTLESNVRRTVERSLMQTQMLVDAVCSPVCSHNTTANLHTDGVKEDSEDGVDSKQAVVQRLHLFYCSHVPTRWHLQRELASRFLSLGMIKSALDIYERLELWEDCVFCFQRLQQRQRAENMIREQIIVHGETPKLLCLLGDATDNVQCYQRAWQLSNHSSVRAIRSLGLYYYFKQQYEECIPLLQQAVQLNSLQFDVWTRLAYAALQQENWSLSAAAYRRCCALEPENFEAWNNIARAYTQLGDKRRAWRTLQEALRFSFDNINIWHNFLLVSVDIGEFEEAINAYSRLATLDTQRVDCQILSVLTAAVIVDKQDCHGVSAARLRQKLAHLLQRISDTVTNNGVIWRLRADLAATAPDIASSSGDRVAGVQLYQRALRCHVLQAHWCQKATCCREVLELCRKMCACSLSLIEMNASEKTAEDERMLCDSHVHTLMSVRMSVRSTLNKIRMVYDEKSGEDDMKQNVDLIAELDQCQHLLLQLSCLIDRSKKT